MLKEKVYTDFVLILTYVTTRCLSPKNKSSAKKIGTSTVPIPILKKISYHEIHIFKIPGDMENQKLKKKIPILYWKPLLTFTNILLTFHCFIWRPLIWSLRKEKISLEGINRNFWVVYVVLQNMFGVLKI